MGDPRRWLFILMGLALVVSFLVERSRTVEKQAHGVCLVHADCLKSERCLIRPKGDGFASPGECLEPCEDDLQCPAQHHCERASESGDCLLPRGAKGAGTQPAGVCAPGSPAR
jgi:hypothetical protein